MIRPIALVLTLAGAIGLGMLAGRPPAPVSADAPPQVFSAARAQADIAVLARQAHPVGSQANVDVRTHIVRRMSALGLQPKLQSEFGLRQLSRVQDPVFLGGHVDNIVGVLPGRDRTAPALAIMAHYDSVPHSPGAADDAAGVAAALEIARLLKVRGTPVRDVIFLFTDGEEAGLLGAEAFFSRHPQAKRIGFLVNMEARGGGGLVQMFQTGPRNEGTVGLLRATANRPSASSLSVLLYSAMPNDTDFTVSRSAGVDGLNFAFIGRQFDYHAATSTLANLEAGSLQHLGDQVAAVALDLSSARSLPARGPDQVFSHIFGDLVIAYPGMAGWWVLAASAGLIALAVRNGRRRGLLDAPGVLRGVGAAAYLLLLSGALLHLARRIAAEGHGFLEQRALLARVTVWETAILLVGLAALLLTVRMAATGRSRMLASAVGLATGAAALAFGWDIAAVSLAISSAIAGIMTFGTSVRVAPAWTGILLTGLGVGLLLQGLAPTAAFLVAWPLLAASLLAVITTLGAGGTAGRLGLTGALVGIPTLAWVLGYAHGVFLGLDLPALLSVFVWLAAFLLWPLMHPGARDGTDGTQPRSGLGRVAAAGLLGGLALAAVLRWVPPWTERFPQATLVQHLYDADTGRASWISTEPRLSPWSRRVLAHGGARPTKVQDDLVARRPYWSSPARSLGLDGAALSLEPLAAGEQRLVIRPPLGAARLDLQVRSDTAITGVRVNGRPAALLATPGVWNRIRLSAPGETQIEFRPAGPGALDVRALVQTADWPASLAPLPERRPAEMAFGDSDTALVRTARNLRW